MPITLGAIRKQRADKRKSIMNTRVKLGYKSAVLAMRKKKTAEALKEAFSRLDRAAKTGVIHKNKASRLKARLSKLVAQKAKKKSS